MNPNLSELVLIIDRSGSMESCRVEAENGINHFIAEQQKQPGAANLTLVQFDTVYEFLHKGTPIQYVGSFTLQPRGMTALLDAVGRTITETGQRLAALPEDQRPGLVTVLIVTDGHENASCEFSAAHVKTMIEHQRDKYQWKFNFLGAGEDALTQAAGMGIQRDSAAVYNTQNVGSVVQSMSAKMSAARSATAQCLSASEVDQSLSYNASDRAQYTAGGK